MLKGLRAVLAAWLSHFYNRRSDRLLEASKRDHRRAKEWHRKTDNPTVAK